MATRIKVINWPKNTASWIAVTFSVVAIIVTVIFSISSLSVAKKSLKLSRARITIPNPEIKLKPDPEANGNTIVNLKLALKNTGQSNAEDIRFRLYVMAMDSNIDSNLAVINPAFDDRLLTNLSPEEGWPFGNVWFSVPNSIVDGRISTLLALKIDFGDEFGERGVKWLWWKYEIGSQELFSLLRKELNDEQRKRFRKILKEDSYIVDQILY